MFISDPTPSEFADRLAGFRDGAAAADRTVDVLETMMAPDAVHPAVRRLLARGHVPDCIFAASDIVAMTTLRALAEAGIDVPGDSVVIGYDDVTLAAYTSPPLTTIRQDLETGARLMVDALLAKIGDCNASSSIIAPQLIVRAST